MTQLKELCEALGFDPEVTARVLAAGERCPLSPAQLFARLADEAGELALRQSLENDVDGFQMLACSLLAALETRERYRARGIGDEIFLDTMGCFPRFVREHKEAFGRSGFDRSFWTWRQISLKLFRLGELEFELTEFEEKPAVAVHIPSGADLGPEKCRASYRMAGEFFRTQAPEHGAGPWVCESWLLSPALPGLLPEGSRILAFQRDYDLVGTDPGDREFMMWVFQAGDGPAEELPEDTSLRRNMKRFLLEGGKMGSAVGVLKPGAV